MSGWMIWQKINHIYANPVKAAKDYPWSSFGSFYSQGDAPIPVDREWFWPDDAEKLSKAVKSLTAEELSLLGISGGKPPS